MAYLLIHAKETLASAIVVIPAMLLLRRWFRPNHDQLFWYIVFAVYLSAVYGFVGLPNLATAPYMGFYPNLNWRPFAGMAGDLQGSLMNIALFVPLGFFLPWLWKRFRSFPMTLLGGIGLSLAIELMQLFVGRATDINDFMTNTLGALLGFALAKLLPRNRMAGRFIGDLWKILAVVCGTMFFLQPFAANVVFDILG